MYTHTLYIHIYVCMYLYILYMCVCVYNVCLCIYIMNGDQQITSLTVLLTKHVSKKTFPTSTVLWCQEL